MDVYTLFVSFRDHKESQASQEHLVLQGKRYSEPAIT